MVISISNSTSIITKMCLNRCKLRVNIFYMTFFLDTEYAAVGYIAKRIEMRKKRYQNLQKLAEQRRAAMASSNAGADGEQASSTVAKSHVSTFLLSQHSPKGRHLF